ncbi:hypothetical protein AGOR_G00162990 [Albula goreensis]|uniref:Uncharacterized protein n=1 Tax=Albula goreensis TaxID=1534307 RepID=A0A8T3CVT2_9TELE|nr:hypothetical protein AGOR_G00162990 [Albula goreensis]
MSASPWPHITPSRTPKRCTPTRTSRTSSSGPWRAGLRVWGVALLSVTGMALPPHSAAVDPVLLGTPVAAILFVWCFCFVFFIMCLVAVTVLAPCLTLAPPLCNAGWGGGRGAAGHQGQPKVTHLPSSFCVLIVMHEFTWDRGCRALQLLFSGLD